MGVSRRLGGNVPTVWRWVSTGRGFSSNTGDLMPTTAPPKIGKLLVANRGEIACRIFTTAKRLGTIKFILFKQCRPVINNLKKLAIKIGYRIKFRLLLSIH